MPPWFQTANPDVPVFVCSGQILVPNIARTSSRDPTRLLAGLLYPLTRPSVPTDHPLPFPASPRRISPRIFGISCACRWARCTGAARARSRRHHSDAETRQVGQIVRALVRLRKALFSFSGRVVDLRSTSW